MSNRKVEVEGGPETVEVEGSPETTVTLTQDAAGVIELRSATVTELAHVETFEDALRLAQSLYGDLIPSYSLGDGFVGIEDKDELLGVPFVVMGWGLGWSSFADDEQFSILRVVTQDGRKIRFSDGGSGVHRTMVERFGTPERFVALVALGGLSKGEYTPRNADGSPVTDGKGKPVLKATTYRFDVETMNMRDAITV